MAQTRRVRKPDETGACRGAQLDLEHRVRSTMVALEVKTGRGKLLVSHKEQTARREARTGGVVARYGVMERFGEPGLEGGGALAGQGWQ